MYGGLTYAAQAAIYAPRYGQPESYRQSGLPERTDVSAPINLTRTLHAPDPHRRALIDAWLRDHS